MIAGIPKPNGSTRSSATPAGVLSPDDLYLQALIDQLARDRLIVAEAPGEYAFRHTLTRDAVYGTLVRAERQPLHLAVAETIEHLYPDMLDAHLADLAYHFHEAGAWDKAVDYGGRAGAKAQSMYAPREAIQHCSQAIEAALHAGRTAPPALYRTRGQAYDLIGEFDHALADFEQERASAQALGDARAEWQSLVDIGFLWAARDYGRTGEYLRQALDVARRLGDDSILGHTLNRVGNWYGNIEHLDQALRYHHEALALFQARNDRRGLAETYDLLGLAALLIGDVAQEEQYFRQAIPLFRELGDRVGLSSSLANYSERGNSYLAGIAPNPIVPIAHMTAEAQEAVEVARDIGWRSGEAYARLNVGTCSMSSGNYAFALKEIERAVAIATEIEHQQWCTYGHICLSLFYAELLAGPQARQHAEQGLALAFEIGSLNFVRFATGALVTACVVQDYLSRAEFVLGTVIGQPELIAGVMPSPGELRSKGLTATLSGRLCYFGLASLAQARGKSTEALEYAEELLATSPNLDKYGSASLGQLMILRADALIAVGRAAEAEAPILACLADSEARGAPPAAWRLHATLSRLYRALGQAGAAAHASAQGQAIVSDLAANVPEDDLRENFLRRAAGQFAR